jgi:hypothetical protein
MQMLTLLFRVFFEAFSKHETWILIRELSILSLTSIAIIKWAQGSFKTKPSRFFVSLAPKGLLFMAKERMSYLESELK